MKPRRIHEGDPGYEEARRREEQAREELWEAGKCVVLDTLLWVHQGGEDPRSEEDVARRKREYVAAVLAAEEVDGLRET